MAVTAEKATQITNTEDDIKNKVSDFGKVRIARFDFTQGAAAGDIGSTADLVKLPSGRIRLLTKLSRLAYSAFGAARTLDVGHTGWTKPDGSTEAAVADAFVAAEDVSSAGAVEPAEAGWLLPDQEIESKDGTTIQATVAGDTIPAAATLKGWIAYVTD